MPIELRFIRHAIALARHRNYARAAQSLGLTQPALSRSIATLEAQLGVRLFDRASRGVEPTAFGRLFIERGGPLLRNAVDLRRELTQLKALDAGELTVAAGTHAGTLILGEAIAELVADHPRLRLKISLADFRTVGRRVLQGDADVGLADVAWADEPRLAVEHIGRNRLVVAVRPSHPLAGRRHVTLEQLLEYPVASTPLPVTMAATLPPAMAALQRDDLTGDAHTSISTDSLELAQAIAERTDAVFPVMLALIAAPVRARRLVLLDSSLPWNAVNWGILTLAGRTPSPAAQAFMERVRAVTVRKAELEAALESELGLPRRGPRRKRPPAESRPRRHR
jgi:DNA-binding transcriptional LysR family regulator